MHKRATALRALERVRRSPKKIDGPGAGVTFLGLGRQKRHLLTRETRNLSGFSLQCWIAKALRQLRHEMRPYLDLPHSPRGFSVLQGLDRILKKGARGVEICGLLRGVSFGGHMSAVTKYGAGLLKTNSLPSDALSFGDST